MANLQISGQVPARIGRGPESELIVNETVVSEPKDGQSMADHLHSFFKGEPWVKVTDESRARIDGLGFCDYWRTRFAHIRTFVATSEGWMAQHILDVALEKDGTEFVEDVAGSIGKTYGEAVLEADIDGIVDFSTTLQQPNLGDLAEVLLALRKGMEAEKRRSAISPTPIPISDSWIILAHLLSLHDTEMHKAILEELAGKLGDTGREMALAIEMERGLLGGADEWVAQHQIFCDVAEILAKHFPEIVFSRLIEPPLHDYFAERGQDQPTVKIVGPCELGSGLSE
jgi:hypothetical protein